MAERGQDFVADSPPERGKIVNGDAAAQNLDPSAPVEQSLGNVRRVVGDQVHRHTAQKREPMLADIGRRAFPRIARREGAEEPVGVTKARRCDSRPALQCVRGAVAHSFPGVRRMHLRNAPEQGDDRLDRICGVELRISSVKGDAGAGHIEMVPRAKKDPSRISEAARDSGEQGRNLREERPLRLVHRTSGVIAADEMRHNEAQLEGRECSALVRKCRASCAFKPRRAMPVSTWIAAGSLLPRLRQQSAHSATSSRLPRTGRTRSSS